MRPYLTWATQAIDAELIPLAWNLCDRDQAPYWDSFIVAAAQRARGDVRYSEDMQAGVVFDSTLRVVNPLTEGSDVDRYTVQEPKAIRVKRSI